MPFLDSLDVANRALQLCGLPEVLSPDEDSQRCREVSAAYDKVRRAELRRNVWRFAVRKAVLRPVATTTLLLRPGLYDATKTYLTGEVVRDTNGLMWISATADNTNNTPGGNNEDWEMYFGPATASLYDSGTTYFAGELVYVLTGTTPNGYQVYMSLISGNSDTPGTATAYVSTTQYKQNDTVSSGGSQWRSLLPVNQGNTPADGPLPYDSTATYSAAQTVTGSDNYIYSSVAGSNTGHDPVTDGGAHWTNTGALNAWDRTPTLITSAITWRPIIATLENMLTMYPIGSGPTTQTGTRNAFRLPAGYMRKAPQNAKGGVLPALGGPSFLSYDDWDFDGHYIVSSTVEPIVFRFVADVSTVSQMDDMFCEGLACRIAAAVCQSLTQSTDKLAAIASQYKLFMGEARLANAIEEGTQDLPDDEYIAVRA
jgi:hypothetical protein